MEICSSSSGVALRFCDKFEFGHRPLKKCGKKIKHLRKTLIDHMKKNSHWLEQDTVRPDPSCVLLLPVNRYQLFDINWFRYLVVVNVYKIGFTAEFSGSTNTTRNAYKSARRKIGIRQSHIKCGSISIITYQRFHNWRTQMLS